jgi:rhodanese-related sulfurtransferase
MNSRFFWLLIAAALPFWASCAGKSAPAVSVKPVVAEKKRPKLPSVERGKVTTVSLTEAFELQQSGEVLIYDARPSYYHSLGHLPGAIPMPKSICDEVIEVRQPELKAAVAANKRIIVYCTGFLCSDARTVANHLAAAGYSSSILQGGWDAWKSAELPTE